MGKRDICVGVGIDWKESFEGLGTRGLNKVTLMFLTGTEINGYEINKKKRDGRRIICSLRLRGVEAFGRKVWTRSNTWAQGG